MPPLPTSPFPNSMKDASLATKLSTKGIVAVVCYGHCGTGMVLGQAWCWDRHGAADTLHIFATIQFFK